MGYYWRWIGSKKEKGGKKLESRAVLGSTESGFKIFFRPELKKIMLIFKIGHIRL